MYCRNCGQKMAEGDKFCSSCGAKAVIEDNSPAAAAGNAAAPEVSASSMQAAPDVKPEVPDAPETTETAVEDAPLFEPFDFKAFGFDFSELGLGAGVNEDNKPTPPTETFDWNTGEFPDRNNATKTEEVNFNWSLTPDEPVAPAAPEVETPVVSAPEMPQKTETVKPAAPETSAPEMTKKEEPSGKNLFENLDDKAAETRKQSEEIDKFFTFHHKNEEFQKILDREYEKVKSGNIIADELSAAEADAEEKFTSRKPEDPMEELFNSEGVVKVYEPKPVETDVLERIEAAEEEKRIKEEAERLIAQEREKARLEEEAAKAAAEEAARIAEQEAAAKAAEEAKIAEQEAAAKAAAEAEAAKIAEQEAAAKAAAEAKAAEEAAKAAAQEEPASESAQSEDVFDIFAELESLENMEPAVEAEPKAEPAVEIPQVKPEAAPEAPAAAENIEEPTVEMPEIPEEKTPEKTKAVDKAAILARMAIADEMVERDRAIAAEQAAAEGETAPAEASVSQIEATNVELPDFLGHEDIAAETAAKEKEQEAPAENAQEPVQQEAPAAESSDEDDVEFDIFEQLEKGEEPAEEIVLTDSQTLVDLFADAETETLQNHEKGFTEHTLILSEDSVAEILNGSGEEVTEDTMLFSAETLGAILAEAEQENPDAAEVVVSVESLTDVPEAAAADGVDDEIEEEEEHHGGKGRVVLKVLLVILIILLVMEVAGVIIKIAAPTSGAANFIDNQLNKVFQLISGEDDKTLSVFAEAEEIRTEPIVDKTELIAAEQGKNKDGNIASIVYNRDLAFEAGKKYENTDLNLAQDMGDVAWYKNADNKQVYYDQAIVGAMIAYDSQRVNMVNHGDTNVLNLMIEGTDLYNEISASAGGASMVFDKLEIGEIRQSGSVYYVWVSETVNGKSDAYIYEVQPVGETIKIKARYAA